MGLIHILLLPAIVWCCKYAWFIIFLHSHDCCTWKSTKGREQWNEPPYPYNTIHTYLYDYVVCIVFGNVRSAGCLCHPTSEVNCTYNYLNSSRVWSATEQEVETNNRIAQVSVSTYMYTVSRLCTPYTCYIHICMYLTAGYVALTNIETSLHRPLDGMYIRVLLCKTNTHASIWSSFQSPTYATFQIRREITVWWKNNRSPKSSLSPDDLFYLAAWSPIHKMIGSS